MAVLVFIYVHIRNDGIKEWSGTCNWNRRYFLYSYSNSLQLKPVELWRIHHCTTETTAAEDNNKVYNLWFHFKSLSSCFDSDLTIKFRWNIIKTKVKSFLWKILLISISDFIWICGGGRAIMEMRWNMWQPLKKSPIGSRKTLPISNARPIGRSLKLSKASDLSSAKSLNLMYSLMVRFGGKSHMWSCALRRW